MVPLRPHSSRAIRQFNFAHCQQSISIRHPVPLSVAVKNSARPTRKYATRTTSPLVYVRPQASTGSKHTATDSSSSTQSMPPSGKSQVVFAPYFRIGLGILFCGTLIYSMVCCPPPLPLRLVNLPTAQVFSPRTPPPGSLNLPPSPIATPSQNENPA